MKPTAVACFLAALLSNFSAVINLMNESIAPDPEPELGAFLIGAIFVPAVLGFAGVLMWQNVDSRETVIPTEKEIQL